MPRAANSTAADMSGYEATPPAAPVQQPPAGIAPRTGMERHPMMIASMPGISSGPDAILRQFNGGRAVPQSRIYVP